MLETLSALSIDDQILKLLDQNNFKDALKTIGQKKDPQSLLYAAYAKYRLNQAEACLALLADLPASRGVMHLRAQAYYKLERTDEALRIYEALQSQPGQLVVNEKEDTAVNVLALGAQQSLLNKSETSTERPSSKASHELLFNYSILLSSQHRTSEALEVLAEAKTSLTKLGLSEEEYDYEVGPLLAQEAYLRGDVPLYEKIKSTDAVTRYITDLVLMDTTNPFKIFKAYNNTPLFSYQACVIEYNRIIAAHNIGQSVKNAVQKYCNTYKDEKRCAALKLLVLSKATNASLLEVVKSGSEEAKSAAAIALITRYVGKPGSVAKSLRLLDGLNVQPGPGLISIRCQLLDLMGKNQTSEDVEKYLEKCLSHATDRKELLAGSIQRTMNRQHVDELLALDPSHPIALSAITVLDPSSTHEIPLPELPVSFDVPAEKEPIKSKKRKRKGLVDGLDPERWLPKRDRSDYKPTRREKERMKGAHQGGMK